MKRVLIVKNPPSYEALMGRLTKPLSDLRMERIIDRWDEHVITSGFNSLPSIGVHNEIRTEIGRISFEASLRIWESFKNHLGVDDTENLLFDGFLKQFIVKDVLCSMVMEIEAASVIIEDQGPELVFIQDASNVSRIGKAFELCARKKGIKTSILESFPVRSLRDWLGANGNYAFFSDNLHFDRLFISNEGQRNPSMRVLIDVPYFNWFKATEPVAEELLRRDAQIAVICKGFIPSRLGTLSEKEGWDISKMRSDLLGRTRKLLKEYGKISRLDSYFKSIFSHKGIDFWPAIRVRLNLAMFGFLPLMPENTALCQCICEEIKPDVLLIATMPGSYLLGNMTAICRQKGIPIVELQHGIFDPLTEQNVNPGIESRVAAGGELWKNKYVEKGVMSERVEVTGWPKYDIYNSGFDDHLPKNANLHKVLYISEGVRQKQVVKLIRWKIKNRDSSLPTLLIKPRPTEHQKEYGALTRGSEGISVLDPFEEMKNCISFADAVIIHSSTAGMEAVFMNRPLACLNLNCEDNPLLRLYLDSGVAMEIRDFNQLNIWFEALKEIADDPVLIKKRKHFVSENAYLLDGKASIRVTDVLFEQVNQRRDQTDGRSLDSVRDSLIKSSDCSLQR